MIARWMRRRRERTPAAIAASSRLAGYHVPPAPTIAELAHALGMSEELLRERGEAYRRWVMGGDR